MFRKTIFTMKMFLKNHNGEKLSYFQSFKLKILNV